jgi:signal transduction histidine kinase
MKVFQSTDRTFFCIEWLFIAMYLIIGGLNGSFSYSMMTSLQILAFLLGYGILSFFFPVRRSLWMRLLYVFLGALLTISAECMQIVITFFLHLYIAKSCFLLGRKPLIWTITTIFGLDLLATLWLMPDYLDFKWGTTISPEKLEQMKMLMLNTVGFNLAMMILTLILSFMAIAEQKSRHKAEALTQQMEALATDLERTRIARDIHDSLGHTLTNLDMQLAVAQRLCRRDADQTLQALNTAKLLSNQCIEDVSHALQAMRQSNFDLHQSLHTLLEQIKRNTTIQIQEKVSLPPLSLQGSYQIYCILKEGLLNVQKHANASQILLQAQTTPEAIHLELKDNGQGFIPEQPQTGLGLVGIAERIQTLGGQLILRSQPQQGTHLQITIPRSSVAFFHSKL